MAISKVQQANTTTIYDGLTNSQNPAQQGVIPVGKKVELKKDVKDFIEQYALLNSVESSILIEKLNEKVVDVNSLDTASLEKMLQDIISKLGEVENTNIEENKTDDVSTNDVTNDTKFNHKEYNTKTLDEKIEILVEEIAKNEFIYGDKPENFDSMNPEEKQRWIEEKRNKWNSLSEEQRKSYIEAKKEHLTQVIIKLASDKTGKDVTEISIKDLKNFLINTIGEKDINSDLNQIMTALQAANKKDILAKEIKGLKKEQVSGIIHDYVFEMQQDNPELLTDEQKEYIEESKRLTAAIIHHSKNDNTPEFGDLGEGSVFTFNEIDNYIKNHNTSRIEVLLNYLEDKQNKGITLTPEEQEKLKELKNLQTVLDIVKEEPCSDSGRLKALKDSDAGKLWGETDSSKKKALRAYLNSISNFTPEEYSKAVLEMARELQSNQATQELGSNFIEMALHKATAEQKDAISKSDNKRDMAYNAVHINSFDTTSSQNVAEIQKQKKETQFAKVSINVADEEHLLATKTTYSSFGDDDVERGFGNAAFDRSRVGNEAQAELLEAVSQNSSLNVRKDISIRLPEAYKENQENAVRSFIQDKEVALYMNKQNILHKFDKDNQLGIFKIYQNRFEQNDFDRDETISNLNHLSDQIKDCDKNNQLEMHNDIMSSKYSEVQTHAAGNIKSYDPSVQADAYETVFASGNQKAVEVAFQNLQTAPSEIQNAVVKSIINTAFDESASGNVKILLEKIKSGSGLTQEEYNSLTAKQKQEYKAAYFKSLSPAKQIALINSLSDMSTKKAVIKKIAQSDTSFLKQLIDSDAKTAEMVYGMGILQDYIKSRAEFKSGSNNDFQNLLTIIEKKEAENHTSKFNENPITARTLRNIPEGLDSIYRRHAKGGLLA